MSTVELMRSNELAQAAGWTLLHFVWQGCLIALLPLLVRALSTRQSARLRYVTSCLALLLMAVTPPVTFSLLEGPSAPAGGLVLNSERLSASPSLGRWTSATSLKSFSPSWLQNIEAGVSPWIPWLTLAWLCGVCFLSLRLAGGLFYTQRLRKNRTVSLGKEWQETLLRLCQRLQVKQKVALLESACIQVPTVIGWLRPVILLPASTLTGLTARQLEAILAHELAHIRRHDYLVNLLQTAVETLLFYHPAVWWVSRQVRLEREHCCDDLAVAVQGDALAFARALAELETWRAKGPHFASGCEWWIAAGAHRAVARSFPACEGTTHPMAHWSHGYGEPLRSCGWDTERRVFWTRRGFASRGCREGRNYAGIQGAFDRSCCSAGSGIMA